MIRDTAAVKAQGSNVPDSALYSTDEELFRERCRSFLRAYPFDATIDQDAPEALGQCRAYQAALFEAGLAGLTYPQEWGGQGLTSRYQDRRGVSGPRGGGVSTELTRSSVTL